MLSKKNVSNLSASDKQNEINRITKSLSSAISMHRLIPGQRLIESQIVEALGANRNHVQAALQRLALQHIVKIEPNRGATVAKPTAEEARNIFFVRRTIERGIIEHISVEQLQKNKKRIDAHLEQEKIIIQSKDRQKIVETLSGFHNLLAEICGNKVLTEIFDNLMTRSYLIVALYQHNDVPSCASDEHQQIINALLASDTSKAVQLMLSHLDELEAQLVLDKDEGEFSLIAALKDL